MGPETLANVLGGFQHAQPSPVSRAGSHTSSSTGSSRRSSCSSSNESHHSMYQHQEPQQLQQQQQQKPLHRARGHLEPIYTGSTTARPQLRDEPEVSHAASTNVALSADGQPAMVPMWIFEAGTASDHLRSPTDDVLMSRASIDTALGNRPRRRRDSVDEGSSAGNSGVHGGNSTGCELNPDDSSSDEEALAEPDLPLPAAGGVTPNGHRIIGLCPFRQRGMMSLDAQLRMHAWSDRVRTVVSFGRSSSTNRVTVVPTSATGSAPVAATRETASLPSLTNKGSASITSAPSSPSPLRRSAKPASLPVLRSTLKPFDAGNVRIYHYAPLTLADAMASTRDPRLLLPRGRAAKSPALALSMAPEMFQQPWTYTQMIYAVRAPVDSPIAWLGAVLDVNTIPGGMALDLVTRWNAYGPAGVSTFATELGDECGLATAKDLEIDSGLDLAEGRRSPFPASLSPWPSSGVPLASLSSDGSGSSSGSAYTSATNVAAAAAAGVSTPALRKSVSFAPTLITAVAVIPAENKGKHVKRTLRDNPYVLASPDDAIPTSSRSHRVFSLKPVPRGAHAADTVGIPADWIDAAEEAVADADLVEPRLDMSHLAHARRSRRVWVVASSSSVVGGGTRDDGELPCLRCAQRHRPDQCPAATSSPREGNGGGGGGVLQRFYDSARNLWSSGGSQHALSAGVGHGH
ncbi:hypothetical protein H9P43_010063 [Blastocladiella emersonii ATCC 22665]|nr:hypothetical protein H9P43_010063 [Blastocladiella emersonii ATCC 22665]